MQSRAAIVLNRTDRNVLFMVSLLGIGGLLLTLYFIPAILTSNPYDRYSLASSILVALMLGIYFWYLQKKDSDKIDALVKDVHGYVKQSQALVANIKAGYLTSIKYLIVELRDDFAREKTLADQDKEEAY